MRSEPLACLSQGLLIPLTLSFSKAEAELLRAHLEIIQKFGIQIREIGQTIFLIEAISPFLEEGDVRIALDEMIGELQGIEDAVFAQLLVLARNGAGENGVEPLLPEIALEAHVHEANGLVLAHSGLLFAAPPSKCSCR